MRFETSETAICDIDIAVVILGEKTLITNKKPLEAPLDKKTKRAKKASKNLWPAAAGTATAAPCAMAATARPVYAARGPRSEHDGQEPHLSPMGRKYIGV